MREDEGVEHRRCWVSNSPSRVSSVSWEALSGLAFGVRVVTVVWLLVVFPAILVGPLDQVHEVGIPLDSLTG